MLRHKNAQLRLLDLDPTIFAFLKAVLRYSLSKSVQLFYYLRLLLFGIQSLASNLKFQIIRRLIWGGGRLGQPVAHAGVLALALGIFLVGGMFSGSSIVRGATINNQQSTINNQLADLLTAETTIETREPENRPRDEVFEYEVQPGDTLSTVGEKFQISVETIRYANDLKDVDSLAVGQKLVILPVSGARHEVKAGDTVESIAEKYKVSPQAVVDFNYLNEPFALNIGDTLTIPEATIPKPAPPAPSYAYVPAPLRQGSGGTSGTGAFVWPTDSRMISQYFSYWHPAIDITQFSPIYAADAGTVVRAGWSPVGYGYLVEVDHGNGYKTGYAHLSRIDVSVGQTVGKGQVVGMMGATGRAWGVHLHFMVWSNGRFINPLSVL